MKYRKLCCLLILCVLCLTGCYINSSKQKSEKNDLNNQEVSSKLNKIIQCCQKIYEQEYKEVDTLEEKQKIINYFGKEGYSAVDTENQINMEKPEPVEKFCEAAQNKKEAEVTVLLIVDGGSLVCYDFTTKHGDINVERNALYWENNQMKAGDFEKYKAYTWSYTKKGYLFIEQYHKKGYDGPPGQMAIRVKPLDQTCRNLTQKYVMPVGYERNNLLITNWSENDYGEVDFYDMYECMYYMKYGAYVPYEEYYSNYNNRAEYEIANEEFEEVIQTYFSIDCDELRKKTFYNEETHTYRYRPRGMYDAEEPYEPYPEVIGYEKQDDRTIKLIVEAVWTIKNKDQALTSELVVRPLKDGGFQYVSNHILNTLDSTEPSWYRPRLTDKEWQKIYVKGNS